MTTQTQAPEVAVEPTQIIIARPHVIYGPSGVTPADADADYLRCAARNLDGGRGQRFFGSNLTATIIQLLKDAANALTSASSAGPTREHGPELLREYDEDGQAELGTLTAAWSVSFGCRVNFGPDPDGALRATVNVSDAAQRDGVATQAATSADLRQLAAHLLAVADEHDAHQSEEP